MYGALVGKSGAAKFDDMFNLCPEASALIGHMCGNTRQDGILTANQAVRIHSCDRGSDCEVMRNNAIVWIQPVVAHVPGEDDIHEFGVGGGGSDLRLDPEVDVRDEDDIRSILDMWVAATFS